MPTNRIHMALLLRSKWLRRSYPFHLCPLSRVEQEKEMAEKQPEHQQWLSAMLRAILSGRYEMPLSAVSGVNFQLTALRAWLFQLSSPSPGVRIPTDGKAVLK